MNSDEHSVDMNWQNGATKDLKQTPTPISSSKRSRITRACDICRRKKIKCDIDQSQQCTTCKQYGWECTFNDSTKKRGPPKGYIESLETRLRKMEDLLEKMHPEDEKPATPPVGDTKYVSQAEPPAKRDVSPPPVEIPNSVEHSKVVRYLGSSSGYYLVRDILSTKENEIDENQSSKRSSSTTDDTGPLRFKKINVVDNDILFVRDKTLAEHADQLETDKLDLNPSIAPKSVIDELVFRFFQGDHPSLPVIDKEPFLDAYEGRTHPSPAPILVYAICSHVCILLPEEDAIFKHTGLDRRELVTTFLEHATNLVRKEYLTPRLPTIQALVLLCAYPNCDQSFYRNWLRAGMAVRMAQDLGLHRTMEKLPLTEDMFEARKRLFFSCYVTDRWCSAVMGRPLAIADTDCDIDLPHPKGGVNGTKDYSLFINFVKLSGILGEVLRRIYSPKAKLQGYNNISAYHTVQSIYRLLNDWLGQLPDHQVITSDEAKTLYINRIMTNKVREAGPLMVCYHVVVILLYRQFLVSDKKDVFPELYDEAHIRCTEAAKDTMDIARLLSPSDIVRFGWNFAGYSVFQACLIHVYNCTSSVPEIAKTSREYVRICVEECIKPLNKEMSNAPHHAIPLIQTLMDLIGADKKESNSTGKAKTPPDNHTNNIPDSIYNDATTHTNPNTLSQPLNSYSQQPQPSPMSVHAIVSDWNDTPANNYNAGMSNNNNQSMPTEQSNQESFASNNISIAAWQSLFASAATPFFDNESDWQNTLSSLFDDNQGKQPNMFM